MSLLSSTSLDPPHVPGGACLLVHGGAWDIPQAETDSHLDGLQRALERGRALLRDGAAALEAVVETLATMEAHGAFDAGRGAVLTREGTVELDAGVMDGTSLGFGAVAAVRRIEHPVHVARALLKQGGGQARLMVGEGAERFAQEAGFEWVDNATLICERERRRFNHLAAQADYHTSHPFLKEGKAPRGTIGCVARDRQGRLAAATSTGGTPFRPSGRVGDSPLPGAGFYANKYAAASATGWGEAIATVVLCARAVDSVEAGMPPVEAAEKHLHAMYDQVQNREGTGATGGLILLDAEGRGTWAFTTPRMARGGWSEGEEVWFEV